MAAQSDRREFSRREVLDYLSYNPKTGIFRWKVERNSHGGKIFPGDEAGTLKDGYVQIKLFGKVYRAHHLAWLVMTGEWPPTNSDMDHRNRDRADNSWRNLRLATRSQNNMNGRTPSHNKSGVKGVSYRSDIGKWHARIVKNDRVILLGNFVSKADAIAARRTAESQLYGEFAST